MSNIDKINELKLKKEQLLKEIDSVDERMQNLIKLEVDIIGKYFIYDKMYIYVNDVFMSGPEFCVDCTCLYMSNNFIFAEKNKQLYVDPGKDIANFKRISEKEFNIYHNDLIEMLKKF